MLKECKCLLCKHYIKSKPFVHKCKAYPNGIPLKFIEEDTTHKECNSKDYCYEHK